MVFLSFMKRKNSYSEGRRFRRFPSSFGRFRARFGLLAVGLVVGTVSDVAGAEEPTWCAPELETLVHDVCLYMPAKGGVKPTTVVIFLHSLVGRGTSWQWEQQRTMVQTADRHGFAV